MQILQFITYYLLSLIYLLIPSKAFVEGVVGQPASFLPSRAQSQTDKTISSLIYRGLFRYDNFGTLIPDLAEKWEISNEGLVYTIKIKDGQYWSDEAKITADDLIYTSYKIQNLSGVATDKIDALTVRYTLPNKFSPFLSLLTVGVMQNGSDEDYAGLYTASSGPFRVASVKKKGELIKRVILLDLSGKSIQEIVFRFYPNTEELTTAAKLGEINAFLLDEKDHLSDGTVQKDFKLYQYPIQSVYYALFFNLRSEAYKDLAYREKLAKSLNVFEDIKGFGIPVQGAISRNFYTGDKYKSPVFDDVAVIDLLGKEVVIDIPDSPFLAEIASRIKDDWQTRTGASVKLIKHASDEIRSKVIEGRSFDVLLFGQEVGRDPDRYVNWHSTQAEAPGLNLSGFSNVRADRALEEGRKELDPDIRKTHYDEFQRIVNDQVPAIFLHHPYMNYYVNQKVKGLGDKYTFTPADRFLDFNNWYF